MAVLGRSFAPPTVHRYERIPGAPPVRITRLDRQEMERVEPGHAHAHDFLVLAYFERGGGSMRLGGREWPVVAGDAYVVAPGEVVGVGDDPAALTRARGWAVSFPLEGLGPNAPDALLGWRSHPLLLPFVRGAASGAQRLRVPASRRSGWSRWFSELERELRERRDGYAEATVAHLTLLLVEAARLAARDTAELRLGDEPLLTAVFEVIESRYHEGISLRDVAEAVHLSPGYLTTVVRRRTGRTVQGWIHERRMAEARRQLVETDRTIGEIADRVGYRDPVHFNRHFRRAHGTTPQRWRKAGRA